MTKCTAGGARSRRGAGPRSRCAPECDHPRSQQCAPSRALTNWPSVSPLSGNEQDRILSAKGILNALFGVGVRQPLTIHNEQILVAARIHVQIAHPTAIASLDQRRFLRLPFVEGACHADPLGAWFQQFERNAVVVCPRRSRFRWLGFRRNYLGLSRHFKHKVSVFSSSFSFSSGFQVQCNKQLSTRRGKQTDALVPLEILPFLGAVRGIATSSDSLPFGTNAN